MCGCCDVSECALLKLHHYRLTILSLLHATRHMNLGIGLCGLVCIKSILILHFCTTSLVTLIEVKTTE